MIKPLKITSFSSPFLLTVSPEASIPDVMEVMKESDIRHIPVVKEGKSIGIISERDLKVFEDRSFADKFCAQDIMIADPFIVNENDDLRIVVNTMIEKKYGSCLINNEEGKLSGIFTMIDALKTLKVLLNNIEEKKITITIGQ